MKQVSKTIAAFLLLITAAAVTAQEPIENDNPIVSPASLEEPLVRIPRSVEITIDHEALDYQRRHGLLPNQKALEQRADGSNMNVVSRLVNSLQPDRVREYAQKTAIDASKFLRSFVGIAERLMDNSIVDATRKGTFNDTKAPRRRQQKPTLNNLLGRQADRPSVRIDVIQHNKQPQELKLIPLAGVSINGQRLVARQQLPFALINNMTRITTSTSTTTSTTSTTPPPATTTTTATTKDEIIVDTIPSQHNRVRILNVLNQKVFNEDTRKFERLPAFQNNNNKADDDEDLKETPLLIHAVQPGLLRRTSSVATVPSTIASTTTTEASVAYTTTTQKSKDLVAQEELAKKFATVLKIGSVVEQPVIMIKVPEGSKISATSSLSDNGRQVERVVAQPQTTSTTTSTTTTSTTTAAPTTTVEVVQHPNYVEMKQILAYELLRQQQRQTEASTTTSSTTTTTTTSAPVLLSARYTPREIALFQQLVQEAEKAKGREQKPLQQLEITSTSTTQRPTSAPLAYRIGQLGKGVALALGSVFRIANATTTTTTTTIAPPQQNRQWQSIYSLLHLPIPASSTVAPRPIVIISSDESRKPSGLSAALLRDDDFTRSAHASAVERAAAKQQQQQLRDDDALKSQPIASHVVVTTSTTTAPKVDDEREKQLRRQALLQLILNRSASTTSTTAQTTSSSTTTTTTVKPKTTRKVTQASTTTTKKPTITTTTETPTTTSSTTTTTTEKPTTTTTTEAPTTTTTTTTEAPTTTTTTTKAPETTTESTTTSTTTTTTQIPTTTTEQTTTTTTSTTTLAPTTVPSTTTTTTAAPTTTTSATATTTTVKATSATVKAAEKATTLAPAVVINVNNATKVDVHNDNKQQTLTTTTVASATKS